MGAMVSKYVDRFLNCRDRRWFWQTGLADLPRIAPFCRPADIHGTRRHSPSFCSLALDSDRHGYFSLQFVKGVQFQRHVFPRLSQDLWSSVWPDLRRHCLPILTAAHRSYLVIQFANGYFFLSSDAVISSQDFLILSRSRATCWMIAMIPDMIRPDPAIKKTHNRNLGISSNGLIGLPSLLFRNAHTQFTPKCP